MLVSQSNELAGLLASQSHLLINLVWTSLSGLPTNCPSLGSSYRPPPSSSPSPAEQPTGLPRYRPASRLLAHHLVSLLIHLNTGQLALSPTSQQMTSCLTDPLGESAMSYSRSSAACSMPGRFAHPHSPYYPNEADLESFDLTADNEDDDDDADDTEEEEEEEEEEEDEDGEEEYEGEAEAEVEEEDEDRGEETNLGKVEVKEENDEVRKKVVDKEKELLQENDGYNKCTEMKHDDISKATIQPADTDDVSSSVRDRSVALNASLNDQPLGHRRPVRGTRLRPLEHRLITVDQRRRAFREAGGYRKLLSLLRHLMLHSSDGEMDQVEGEEEDEDEGESENEVGAKARKRAGRGGVETGREESSGSDADNKWSTPIDVDFLLKYFIAWVGLFFRLLLGFRDYW